VEKVVVMNCHVQQKVKVGKTVCDEASVVPWEVHSLDEQSSNTDLQPAQSAALPNSPNAMEITNTGFASPEAYSHASDNNYELVTTAPAPPVYAQLRQPDYVNCS